MRWPSTAEVNGCSSRDQSIGPTPVRLEGSGQGFRQPGIVTVPAGI